MEGNDGSVQVRCEGKIQTGEIKALETFVVCVSISGLVPDVC